MAYISIHALREEGDFIFIRSGMALLLFLSTPSARRATQCQRFGPPGQSDFYPRPPRGGRPNVQPFRRGQHRFLSTPSARRATAMARRRMRQTTISIHALREEGDPARPTPRPSMTNFYPRPPRGGRRNLVRVLIAHAVFLSTPSARRAT